MGAVLDFLLVPSNLLLTLGLAGFAALLLERGRLGRWLVGASSLGFLVFGCSSAGELFMAPLTTRFPPLDLDRAPAPYGLILVGGALDESMASHYGSFIELHDGAETLLLAAELAQRYPDTRLVLSGRTGKRPPGLHESDGMRRYLLSQSIDDERMALDTTSLSSVAHVDHALELVGEDRDQIWWLVTQAHRMPRTLGLFRQRGFEPVPVPADFRWHPPFDPFYVYDFRTGLTLTDLAVHEWQGLVLYKLQGRIPELFPGP